MTVSIAAETTGIASSISRVSRVRVETSFGQHLGLGRHEQDVVEGKPFPRELVVEREEALDFDPA